jgi:hypothetical protein
VEQLAGMGIVGQLVYFPVVRSVIHKVVQRQKKALRQASR